ncbi:MAG: hypothetical protein LUH22_01790 [Bacteroides sp.]|nr:hypothetical protein [Bacteroides sp.]
MIDGYAAITSSKDEAKKVFYYAAKTSLVEWGVSIYKNGKAIVGTLRENSQGSSFSPVGDEYKFENKVYTEHSHGGNTPSFDFKPSGEDIATARNLNAVNPKAESWLYMPQNPTIKRILIK